MHPSLRSSLFLFLAGSVCHAADPASVLARIKAPVFPPRDFVITEFGAHPEVDCTAALRAAIDACHNAGGPIESAVT
jgi:hypothetical protein